ncbi:hypothetical protein WDU94_015544 [Cyamophila willieti]
MRTQICSTDKNKVRSVIGYPLECFLEEGRYLYPIMQAFTDNKFGDPPIAYGLEMAKGGMEYMNHMVTDERVQYIGMLDWSSFDKLVPPWLIKDAFAILRGLFDFTKVVDEDGIVHEVKDPQEIENRWNKVIKYFIDTPVRLSDGSRFRKVQRVNLIMTSKLKEDYDEQTRCTQLLEDIEDEEEQLKIILFGKRTNHSFLVRDSQRSSNCVLCHKNHFISNCKLFLDVAPLNRYNLVKRNLLCVNCLGGGHHASECTRAPCSKCQLKHNTLLHFGNMEKVEPQNLKVPDPPRSQFQLKQEFPPM